jgi:hypothetical protein
MKRRLPWILTGVMAAVAVLLALNLREKDVYELGSPMPVDGATEAEHDLRLLVPETTVHDGCAHPLEVVEQRRTLTLQDPDGWYRLFWAGADTLYYKELIHLAVDLQVPGAGPAEGRWTLKVRAGPGPCGKALPEATLEYALKIYPDEFPLQPPGPLGLPGVKAVLTYQCRAEHMPPLLTFVWERRP